METERGTAYFYSILKEEPPFFVNPEAITSLQPSPALRILEESLRGRPRIFPVTEGDIPPSHPQFSRFAVLDICPVLAHDAGLYSRNKNACRVERHFLLRKRGRECAWSRSNDYAHRLSMLVSFGEGGSGEREWAYRFCQPVSVCDFQGTPGFCDQGFCDTRWKVRCSGRDSCDRFQMFFRYSCGVGQLVHHRRYGREHCDVIPGRI